jgi:dsDNA-binding SOS-regulon protein
MDSKELRQMSLDNVKLAMEQWNRLMEPKDWKDEILEREMIVLHDRQREMLKNFYLSHPRDRMRIKCIIDNGYYHEWDKEFLNRIRESYLKGVNWIK